MYFNISLKGEAGLKFADAEESALEQDSNLCVRKVINCICPADTSTEKLLIVICLGSSESLLNSKC